MERSDAELLAASRRGERAAFGALIERYQGVVCAVSYSGTGDRALSEDVAQDTFLAAWRQLDQLREVGRLRAWLCGIARNLARKARRARFREAPVDPTTEPLERAAQGANAGADVATPFERVSEQESETLVRSALDRVPESYREVLILYYREQRSVREVAAVLELSEAAVMQRLSRGRQYLADGVTQLVERSLRGALPRKSLVAGVLAALPPLIASSHADATPRSHGVPMLKMAIFAAVVTAAGTTVIVTRSMNEETTVSASATAAPLAVAAPKQVAAAPSVAPVAAPVAVAAEPVVAAPTEEVVRFDVSTLEKLGLYEGPSQGPVDAPVTIVMFQDLQCKFCSASFGNLDQLQEDYGKNVRLVVKQMPVHKTAVLAAEASLAAESQGKFWELHDLMAAQPEDLSLDAIVALGKQGGLDVARLRKDLEQRRYSKSVDKDMATAAELKIMSTPSFLINGRLVVGYWPMAKLRGIVQEALTEAGVEMNASVEAARRDSAEYPAELRGPAPEACDDPGK